MRNIKFIVWKRSVLSFLHLPVLFKGNQSPSMELISLKEMLAAYHKIKRLREIRVTLLAANRVNPIRLWILVPIIESYNTFFPDKRILTHRLLGKAASGPSPPYVTFLH